MLLSNTVVLGLFKRLRLAESSSGARINVYLIHQTLASQPSERAWIAYDVFPRDAPSF